MPCGERGIFYVREQGKGSFLPDSWHFSIIPVPACPSARESRNRGNWANGKSCGCRNWIYCNEEALRTPRILLYFLLCNEETYSMILQVHDCIRLYNDIGYPCRVMGGQGSCGYTGDTAKVIDCGYMLQTAGIYSRKIIQGILPTVCSRDS